MFYIYIIRSQNTGKYYTGITSDLLRRIRQHNSGANISTKGKGPWVIVYSEEFKDKKLAWYREKQIKKYKSGEAFKKLVN